MFVCLRIITLAPEAVARTDEILASLKRSAPLLPGVRGTWVARVSPVAVINAGHIVWRATYTTEAEALRASGSELWRTEIAPLIETAQVDVIGYRITNGAVRRSGPGIWRALVFRIMPHGFPELAKRLEAVTLLMPDYIKPIRAWALSEACFTEGPKGFTHVWEQEYDSLADLTGEYMLNPVHWGIVDAYFDAEYPEYCVDPQLIQVVGDIDDSIMADSCPRIPETA